VVKFIRISCWVNLHNGMFPQLFPLRHKASSHSFVIGTLSRRLPFTHYTNFTFTMFCPSWRLSQMEEIRSCFHQTIIINCYDSCMIVLPTLACSFMIKCAGPSGRAVHGVGLRPLACCYRGFEFHRGHGCLSVVCVVCCQVEVSAAS
jgi:hypothetical protein